MTDPCPCGSPTITEVVDGQEVRECRAMCRKYPRLILRDMRDVGPEEVEEIEEVDDGHRD
jgi:hypothetical protein